MFTRLMLMSLAMVTAAWSAGVAAERSPVEPVNDAAPANAETINPALAERIAYNMAQGLLRARQIVPASWSATSALLEGAVRMYPDEPRMLRLLTEALLREGEADRAFEVLTHYRRLVPNDEHAQAQWIDLYIAGASAEGFKPLETADAKVAYLKDIIDRQNVPGPVRSHAAFRCAELMLERGQDSEVLAMVDQAIELNPLNIRALRVRFETLKDGSSAERLGAMVAMLRANPGQPGLALAVAQELSEAGLSMQALNWYHTALTLYNRAGLQPPFDVLIDYASHLSVTGDPKAAEGVLQHLVQADQDMLDVWMLRLIGAKAMNDKASVTLLQRQTALVATNRVALLRREIGDETAIVQPVDFTTEPAQIDVLGDLDRILQADRPELNERFAEAATVMSWLKIYFQEAPEDATPWMEALARLVPEDDPALLRLKGWQLLRAGQLAEARTTLSRVADRDPLAAVGLILLTEDTEEGRQRALRGARELLAKNHTGLVGAALAEMLAPFGIRVSPGPEADSLLAALQQLPRDWMNIATEPERFYNVRLEPITSALHFGQPVLLRVTIQNTSDHDLTVGPEGVIRPDLWLDAQLRGAHQQLLPGEGFDRLTGRIVLPGRTGMSQTVRLDTVGLGPLLGSNPTATFQISAMAMTNPTMLGEQIGPGLAGRRVQMTRLIERAGSPLANDQVRQKLNDDMQDGTPADKVRAIEMLATYVQLFAAAEGDAQIRQIAQNMADAIRRATRDKDPGVRAWALYILSLLTGDEDRETLLREMTGDESWQVRLLAPVIVQLTGEGYGVIEPLTEDPDPIVRKLAIAVMEIPVPEPEG